MRSTGPALTAARPRGRRPRAPRSWLRPALDTRATRWCRRRRGCGSVRSSGNNRVCTLIMRTARSWPAVVVLAVLAPVCAEYSSGYLPNTGDPVALVATLVVFAPLYGGAALLVREGAVRTGHGWTGVLLLAMVFGLIEAALIDLSLFTTAAARHLVVATDHRPDDGRPARGERRSGGHLGRRPRAHEHRRADRGDRGTLPPLAAPILAAMASAGRGRRGVRRRRRRRARARAARVRRHPSPPRACSSSSRCVRLLSRRPGRGVPGHDRTGTAACRRAWLLVLTGALTMLVVDCATAGWVWVFGAVAVCGGVAWWLARRGRRASFVGRGAALLAVGALVERALIAFTAPVPDQVSEAAKYAHNVGFMCPGRGARPGGGAAGQGPRLTPMIDRDRLADAARRRGAPLRRTHPRSAALAEQAQGSLLAGVPMPWMTRWPGSFPVFVDSARRARGSPTSTGSSTSTCASATPAR